MIAVAAIARRRSFNCGSIKENRVASATLLWDLAHIKTKSPVIEFIFARAPVQPMCTISSKKNSAAAADSIFLELWDVKKLMVGGDFAEEKVLYG